MPSTEEAAVTAAETAAAEAAAALKASEESGDEAKISEAKTAAEAAAAKVAEAKAAKEKLEDPIDIKADIKELLAKARKDEKDKMYGRVSKLEEEKKAAEEEKKRLQDQVDALIKGKGGKEGDDEAAKKKKEEQAKAGGVSEDQIHAMLEEQLKKMETEVFKPALDSLKAENDALKEENHKTKLESHRNQLITANKDSIIEELIAGNTVEELDASLVTAKQAFAKYNIQATEKAGAAADGKKLPPTPDINGRTPSDPNYIAPGMSQDEYAKNRKEMLAKAAQSVKERL